MLYFITFLGIFLSGLITTKFPFWGRIGTIFWVFSWFLILILAIKQFLRLAKLSWSKKTFATLILVLLLIGIVLVNTTNPKNISGETTQEINCMLTHFESSADWGFFKTCFLGYPARQFILPALPSLVFGRNLFALNFGGAIYFIFALIIFASAVLNYLGNNKTGDIITAIILSFIFHLYYFNHFMFAYEQSIYPFCFTLLAVGLFLDYLSNKSLSILVLIGFNGLYLIFSYTPGLAVFFLIVIALLGLFFSKKINFYHKITIALILILSLVSYLFSLKFRGDIKLVDFGQSSKINIQKDLTDVFYHLNLQKNGSPMVSPIFNFIFLSVLFIPLFFVFGKKMFFGSIWILTVIILSVISKGYSYYGIDFRLHRATIIFPVLFLMIIEIIKPHTKKLELMIKSLTVFLIFILFTGLVFQINYLKNKPESKHLSFINWFIKQGFVKDNKKAINLYFENDPSGSFVSLNDELQYFIPTVKIIFLDERCEQIMSLANNHEYYLISLNEKSFCQNIINNGFFYTDKYIFNGERPYYIFKIF